MFPEYGVAAQSADAMPLIYFLAERMSPLCRGFNLKFRVSAEAGAENICRAYESSNLISSAKEDEGPCPFWSAPLTRALILSCSHRSPCIQRILGVVLCAFSFLSCFLSVYQHKSDNLSSRLMSFLFLFNSLFSLSAV